METATQEVETEHANGAAALPPVESPITFEGLEACFAADLPISRYEFEMFGTPCFVELRGMDDDAFARYESGLIGPIRIDPGTGKVQPTEVKLNRPELELDLLVASVAGFALATRKRAKSGEEVVELTMSHDPQSGREWLNTGQRRDLFRRMAPAFRKRLLAAARRVNGLDVMGFVGAAR